MQMSYSNIHFSDALKGQQRIHISCNDLKMVYIAENVYS